MMTTLESETGREVVVGTQPRLLAGIPDSLLFLSVIYIVYRLFGAVAPGSTEFFSEYWLVYLAGYFIAAFSGRQRKCTGRSVSKVRDGDREGGEQI